MTRFATLASLAAAGVLLATIAMVGPARAQGAAKWELTKEQKDRDPFELAAKIPVEQAPILFIVCGGEDGLAEINHQFISLLAKRRISYEYRELSPREHDWRIWDEEIPIFLDKLDHLEGFGSALHENHAPASSTHKNGEQTADDNASRRPS